MDNGRHAILRDPAGLAVDSAGNVYIAETGMARILKLSASTGSLSTIAGGGRLELGDGGPARDASFLQVSALALSPSGDLFIADPRTSRVRKVSAATGVITTVAGNGFPGFTGDSGIATAAQIDTPNGLTVDKNGNLFIADSGNNRIRRVDAVTGIITTVAGNGGFGFSSDGGPATSAELALPVGLNTGLATDPSGNLFITDTWTNRIRRVDAATGIITTIAGNGDPGFSDDGGPATSAELAFPTGLTIDPVGNVFIADTFSNRIRQVDTATGLISTVAGNRAGGVGDGGMARDAIIRDPSGVAVDAANDIYIADGGNNRIRKISQSTGIITTIAGSGLQGFGGNGGPATAANLDHPSDIVVSRSGAVYFIDSGNSSVRKIDQATGIISAVAGDSVAGFSGDGGPATSALLDTPNGIALDVAGNLYIADFRNNRVRRVDAATGIITTVAGTGDPGSSGDGGPASAAAITPYDLDVDSAGNLYIVDYDSHGTARVRKIDASTGTITTTAGGGTSGYGEFPLPATAVHLSTVGNVSVDGGGDILLSQGSHLVRIDTGTGTLSSVAHGEWPSGADPSDQIDGLRVIQADLGSIGPLTVDGHGGFLVVDTGNDRILRITPRTGPSLVPMQPSRLFDTRPGEPSGSTPVPKQPIGGASELRVHIAGANGVPSNGVGAVALNVTVTQSVGAGFVTVYPCGSRPLASSLNFTAGQTIPNTVIAPLSPDGDVCFYSNTPTHLLADVSGWFPTFDGLTPLVPHRLFDTRPREPDGSVLVPKQPIAGTTELRIHPLLSATQDVGAVVLNVTVTEPTGSGFVTVYPCTGRPTASNLNFTAGQTIANTVIAPLSPDGHLCFFSSAPTHLIADLVGWFDSFSVDSFRPLRLFDTRPGEPASAVEVARRRIGGAAELRVHVAGVGGLPSTGVGAVALNVTVTEPTGSGFITVYPCGNRPTASNLNFAAGQTIANTVIAPVSPDGDVCFYSNTPTHLLADISGWFPIGVR